MTFPEAGKIQVETAVRVLIPREETAGSLTGQVNKKKLPVIWLVGVFHLGERKYFQELQKHLDNQKLVLFEGAGAPSFISSEPAASDEERAKRTLSAMEYLRDRIKLYLEKNGTLPVNLQALLDITPTEKGTSASPRRKIRWTAMAMKDGWKRDIIYRIEGPGSFSLESYGADGLKGGEGPARDLRLSWPEKDTLESTLEKNSVRRWNTTDDSLQARLAKALELEFQPDIIDYDRENFLNSDINEEQLDRILAGNFEGIDALAGESPEEKKAIAEEISKLLSLMKEDSFGGLLAKYSVNLLACSKMMQGIFKLAVMEYSVQTDGNISLLVPENSRSAKIFKVLIDYRNSIVIKDLKRAIESEPAPSSIALLYGVGHMFELEKRLTEELNYRAGKSFWVPVFSVDLAEAGLDKDSVEKIRATVREQIETMKKSYD